ncbi:DUF3899 domain-containing protein [Dellaglioa algida]|uniref:DUF3899 domain-containing protein n=1 Tax=Dellaglioa algida DSM 15638 TaxID=1423719 RepID=A0A0R1HP60_9LACO|nr:DUF3899 domain-containing protein [Dellaglioa algida]KRK45428.1 hypothetical protein FC66_GL001391 [Dellaglioa algida DSM 15638]MDK1718930.1 DUF3899 domain-containing protein [Dellaglioa algida]MDK1726955.1 DUF3899 domain-containing protein [Dellaglioa algida]MDK1730143.1 DUF3899 domain-containing protein [Dellaglioa algida]MDK1733039.1 DUF3899 domain-containing protein [Dellaglioa algida]
MKQVKKNSTLLLSILVMIIAIVWIRVGGDNFSLSNAYFYIGICLILLGICFILGQAQLFAGWFKRRDKGESKEDYAERKIDVRSVGSKKNRPLKISPFMRGCFIIGMVMIVISIAVTL